MSASRRLPTPSAVYPVLQVICGWASPTPPQVALLEVLANKARVLPVGSDLLSNGQAERGHYLLSGWACWRFDLADGRRQIVQLVLPGDRLGSVAHLHGGLAALTPVKIIPVEAVEALCPQETLDWDARARSAAREFELGLVDQIIRLGQLSACERMAHLVLELRRRLVRNGQSPDPTLQFPLTQEVLANALGVSVVHINRVLQKLRKDKLIQLGGGRLTILDLAGLERASGVNRRSRDHGYGSTDETNAPFRQPAL